MGNRVKVLTGCIATVVTVVAIVVRAGQFTFKRRIKSDIDTLLRSSGRVEAIIVAERDLARLPEPVQRWLRHAQVVGKAVPFAVRLEQQGEFRMSEDRGWMPFEAVQYYTTNPPGFVWSVTMHMSKWLTVTGRDKYFAGTGDIEMRVLSLIPVARKRGGGLDQGAMLRFLNETMWFPAAALSPYLSWEAIDANSARATMCFEGTNASAVFMFDDLGRLVNVVAERYNDQRGSLETWSTPITAYGEFGGLRVPVEGEGIWKYDSGDFSYIRLRITEIDYNVSEA